MVSRRLFKNGRAAFGLLEAIIAVAIGTILFAMMTPVAVDFYLDYQLAAETRNVVSLLSQSRNAAMNNRYEKDAGLYIAAGSFIIFAGDNYASRYAAQDQDFPRSGVVSISGISEIVFEALSGRTASTTLTLANGRENKFIYINEEGRIQY